MKINFCQSLNDMVKIFLFKGKTEKALSYTIAVFTKKDPLDLKPTQTNGKKQLLMDEVSDF